MSERLYRNSNDRSNQNNSDSRGEDRYHSTPYYSYDNSHLSLEELDEEDEFVFNLDEIYSDPSEYIPLEGETAHNSAFEELDSDMDELDAEDEFVFNLDGISQHDDVSFATPVSLNRIASNEQKLTNKAALNSKTDSSQKRSNSSTPIPEEEQNVLRGVLYQLSNFSEPMAKFVAGAVYQYVYDQGGFARWVLNIFPEWRELEEDNEAAVSQLGAAFQLGRNLGDGAAIVTGLAEIVAGGGAAAGGGALCFTGIGCIGGAPAVAFGLAIGAHGVSVVTEASTNLAERLGVVFASTSNGNSNFDNTPKAWRNYKGVKLEDGDPKKGWIHIESRHITGTHPKNQTEPADMFKPNTTRAEIDKLAREIIKKGTRVSEDSSKRMQLFELKTKFQGKREYFHCYVDTKENWIITVFPYRTRGK